MRFEVHGAGVSRVVRRVRRSIRMVAAFISLLLPLAVHAQSTPGANSPEDEYKKYIKVSDDIEPLGDAPFGERISLYDGTLSFEQTDISVPGRGPTITIGRMFKGPVAEERRDLQKRAFGDWDIDIPLISTIAPITQQGIHIGWRVNSTNKKTICSNFREPPSVPGVSGDPSRPDWEPGSWWSGYHMRIPGQGTQELLGRSAANTASPYDSSAPSRTYPIVTKQHWVLGCTTELADPALEAFVAYAPDGTRYWFNRLSYRPMTGVTRATNPGADLARTSGMMSPMAALEDLLNREEGRMLVTRVADRFGNAILYNYDAANRLTSIDSESPDDGRHVTLSYDGDRVSSITVQGGAAGTRTWTYNYQPDVLGYRLTSVTQPDGSAWTFNISDLNLRYPEIEAAGTCDAIGAPMNIGQSYTGFMTHPSGLAASFTITPVKRGRSYVPRACKAGPNVPATPNGAGTHAEVPNASYSMAIVQKQFAGGGIGTQTWTYQYSPSNESWSVNCSAGCASTVWTTVVYPDSHAERSTFSNRFDYTESLLTSEEVFEGSVDTTRRRKLTQYFYVAPDPQVDARAAAYPAPWGYMPGQRVNSAQNEKQIPLGSRITIIDDDANPADPRSDDQFTWNVTSFDSFSRPTHISRSNNFGYGLQEANTILDDYPRWVLALPLQASVNGVVVNSNVYDPSTLTLSERYRFGRKVMTYTFDTFGQLASFTDGNNHTTSLSDYKRGIPRTIIYPDTHNQRIEVDDLGQITSLRNQANAITSYLYDSIGRLSQISYPAGDAVNWQPKIFQYSFSGPARGVSGNHWVRTISQGDKVQRTDFDAMLRPRLTGVARASDQAYYVSTATNYDWKGRKTFVSYAVDGAVDQPAITGGTTTTFDVLGRPTRSSQSTLANPIVTITDYLSGGATKTTDPKGIPTVRWHQAFDEPAYEDVVKVAAPEGILQTIERDVFGNPRAITQSDGGATAVTKTMTYDSAFRLCRTWEPESGSEILAYDGADNVAWSVAGASFNIDQQCGQDQVTEIAKTVRAYDAMDRVTSIIYPTGTAPSTFSYDPLGNPATATAGEVSWTYGRNKLGLLTTEVLGVDGWTWEFDYTYDANAALSSVRYPNGETVLYNPDAIGRPTAAGSYLTGATYFPDGDVKSYTLGSGAPFYAIKNDRKLLESFTYGANTPAVGEFLTYDPNGNVSAIDDLSGSDQRHKVMTYDNLNRLLSASANQLWGVESYTYDVLNNIRSVTNGAETRSYNYDAFNRLQSITTGTTPIHSFQYDARGNTVGKDGQVLNFDLANRLTAMPGIGNAYVYDAAGRRVKKVTSSATTYYAYGSAGQLMFEYDKATANGRNYIYLGKKLIASSKASNSVVVGTIDQLIGGASATLNGWACSTGLITSLDVHLYVGGPAGSGTFLGSFRADKPSEAAIQVPCHTQGTAYRFSIPLSENNRIQYAGQPLFVYGISTVGGANTQLTGSGSYNMPPSALAPNPPSSVSASASANLTTITVTWPAVTNTASYAVEQQYNGSATWSSVYTGAATSTAVSNPADGSYVYRVKACNANGCSNPTVSNTSTIAHIPPAPVGINVPGSSTGSVGVTWSASAYATTYWLEHNVSGTWAAVYAGNGTSATINEDSSGNWYYRVRACNANGCSGYTTSGPVSLLLKPSAPPTLNGGGTSNNGAYGITWSASSGATFYNLFENKNGAGWVLAQNAAAQSWSTSGKADATYYYIVQACNASGCSNNSNQIAVTVANIPAVPPQPQATVTLSASQRVVKVTWVAQTYATSYELMENTIVVWSGPELLYSSRQPQGVPVTYKVRACNAVGCSAWSMTRSVTP